MDILMIALLIVHNNVTFIKQIHCLTETAFGIDEDDDVQRHDDKARARLISSHPRIRDAGRVKDARSHMLANFPSSYWDSTIASRKRSSFLIVMGKP
eukprot:6177688-Pleurochrysis_carterae.AAC.1